MTITCPDVADKKSVLRKLPGKPWDSRIFPPFERAKVLATSSWLVLSVICFFGVIFGAKIVRGHKILSVLLQVIGSLKSYDGNYNENFTLKLNFALSKVFCDYSMLVRLYKISGVHFRLLGTNVFHLKLKNEGFSAASSRCRQNLKYENFTSSFGRLRQNIAPKSVLHVQHDYFSSFNQSNY